MRFLQKAALWLTEAEQPIYVRGIAVAPEAVLAVRFAGHRFWIARIADRNLRAVPCDELDAQVAVNEVHCRT